MSLCMYVCMYASMRLLNCSINLSIKDQKKSLKFCNDLRPYLKFLTTNIRLQCIILVKGSRYGG